ncbi:MAG: ribosome maturation factor RimP [Bacteroidota bacterium]
MGKERIETKVERLGNQVAAKLDYELVDVQYRKEGPDWVLRCFIDKENGVGIEDCQRFSEALDKVLDEADPIPGRYLLEVSSPGIERPLKKEGDFIKFKGKTVEIKLNKAFNNRKTYHGELVGIVGEESERKVALKIDDSNILEIPWNEIAKANLLIDIFSGEGGKKRK